jgi:hypothetical protein
MRLFKGSPMLELKIRSEANQNLMDKALLLKKALSKESISSDVKEKGPVQVKLSEYPLITIRLDKFGVRSLFKESLTFRKVALKDYEKKIPYIVESIKKALVLLRNTPLSLEELSFFRHVINWTTTPGQFNSAEKLKKSKLSTGYRKGGILYRGVVLSISDFDKFKSTGVLKHKKYNSWTYSLKEALRFSKGESMPKNQGSEFMAIVFKKDIKSNQIVLNLPQMIQSNLNFLRLAESGFFGPSTEPGTLYSDEVILKPLVLKILDIESYRLFKHGKFTKQALTKLI